MVLGRCYFRILSSVDFANVQTQEVGRSQSLIQTFTYCREAHKGIQVDKSSYDVEVFVKEMVRQQVISEGKLP
jgi:hypothetical protein